MRANLPALRSVHISNAGQCGCDDMRAQFQCRGPLTAAKEPRNTSAHRISAVVCAALALTFASSSAALAHGSTSGNPLSEAVDCARGSGAIFGTDGDDTALKGTSGDDIICGLDGDDTIEGLGANDRIYGGNGNDHIDGQPGNDYIDGGAGNDYLDGGNGNDTILGGDGDDTIFGHPGADTIDGGPGSDTIDGGTGTDKCGSRETGEPLFVNCP